MRQLSATIDRCPACGSRTARWLDYFCPDCRQHHDALYLAEAPDSQPRSREQIAREYRIVGMTDEAERLTDLPMLPPSTERPAPSTEPTAFAQPSLLDRLESAYRQVPLMTDHEFTDKLAITLILWDHDRRDEVYVTIHPVFIDVEPRLKTYSTHMDRDEPGIAVTELPLTPKVIDQFVAGLRAHTYAERRATFRPRPRDHTERRGRRPGPCIECLSTGWIVIRKGRRHPVPGRPELWGPRPLRWQPCPRCLNQDAQAA